MALVAAVVLAMMALLLLVTTAAPPAQRRRRQESGSPLCATAGSAQCRVRRRPIEVLTARRSERLRETVKRVHSSGTPVRGRPQKPRRISKGELRREIPKVRLVKE